MKNEIQETFQMIELEIRSATSVTDLEAVKNVLNQQVIEMIARNISGANEFLLLRYNLIELYAKKLKELMS